MNFQCSKWPFYYAERIVVDIDPDSLFLHNDSISFTADVVMSPELTQKLDSLEIEFVYKNDSLMSHQMLGSVTLVPTDALHRKTHFVFEPEAKGNLYVRYLIADKEMKRETPLLFMTSTK